MGLNITIEDMKLNANSLRPVMIFPIKFTIEEPNPTIMAVLIKMYTWAEYFPSLGFQPVSQSIRIGTFSLQDSQEFEFEIPFETIRKLNDARDNDTGFDLRASAIYEYRRSNPTSGDVCVQITTSSTSVAKKVPSSEWIKFLNSCGYSELEHFAMHYSVRKELDDFRKVLGDPKMSYDDAIRDAIRRAKGSIKT